MDKANFKRRRRYNKNIETVVEKGTQETAEERNKKNNGQSYSERFGDI